MAKYWLIKSEPDTFSWADLCRLGQDMWDGVRNYQARNYLKEMQVGDLALFYHSGKEKAVRGIVKITRAYYSDPTAEEPHSWVVVDVVPMEAFLEPLTLRRIKQEVALADMVLVRNPRLSVQPVEEKAFLHLLTLVKRDTSSA